MGESFLGGRVFLEAGDCRDVLAEMPSNLFHACVTDPPYHLTSIVQRFGGVNAAPVKAYKTGAYGGGFKEANGGTGAAFARMSRGFMGKVWDGGDVAFRPETWAEVLRVLRPGAHLVAFGGTRTFHRLVCAIEDAGFEVRDCVVWAYGSGFPKSHDVSKAIDKRLGAEREKVRYAPRPVTSGTMAGSCDTRPWIEKSRELGYHEVDSTVPATDRAAQWSGWGSALKPAVELVCLARKPLSESTISANVLRWGSGALNIDACKVATDPTVDDPRLGGAGDWSGDKLGYHGSKSAVRHPSSALGRFPSNLIHDGSDEVVAAFPETNGQIGGCNDPNGSFGYHGGAGGQSIPGVKDSGSAARFFASFNGRDGEASAERRYTEEGSTNFAALPGARRDGVEASRLFYQTKQDLHCGLCHSLYDASCNANTAENSSKTASILSENIVRSDALGSLVPESVDKQSHGRGHARNAAHGLHQCHPLSGSSAQQHAHDWPLSRIVQNVKSAAILCDSCVTDIARALVALRQVRSVASVQFKDFIGGRNAPILCQHLALYAVGRESTDIILTTESLKQLFGSVFHAIESCTAQNGDVLKESNEKSKRLWYGSKADFEDRAGSSHPCIKPLDLIQYLCRLICPPGGTVLDPFAGTGTTGEAAWREGFEALLIERDAGYRDDIRRRMALALAGPEERARESIKARGLVLSPGPLFDGLMEAAE